MDLSHLTDDRDSGYLRFYVGQFKNPRWRVAQHIRNIVNSTRDTLHYYLSAEAEPEEINVEERVEQTDHEARLKDVPDVENWAGDKETEVQKRNRKKRRKTQAAEGRVNRREAKALRKQALAEKRDKGLMPESACPICRLKSRWRVDCPKLELHGSPDPDIRSWPEFRAKQLEGASWSLSQDHRIYSLCLSDTNTPKHSRQR